ncbi:TPR-like protein [Guyanagaster necrorhizus]|uniref:TPR-like protein n=1 Tax=Guyanagaster necrorhizus TaxID=856835 RepID=A0A9P7W2Y0_9AGAR|nr:TPR-like protein [Guyanagaster necrorhizus MCA 3950]KAG7451197.1 TPR-like protein [Guyanagaster necrorhizus MCA 3950]
MGRTKVKKKAKSKAVDPPPQDFPQKGPSISSLLEKAQSFVNQCDYDLARRFILRILETEPSNIEAQEMLGVIELERGDIDAAKRIFTAIISARQDSTVPPPPSAHLCLAQLCEDEPRLALQHYQVAIDMLMAQLKGKVKATGDDLDNEAQVKSSIVRALIGQVEIWMDPSYDLCFEDDAEKNCENLLTTALQTDPGNSEALQSLASVRMSQQRPEEAKDCLEKAWSAWKDLDIDDARVPPIATRISLVKLFLELELYAPALHVLHGVMLSDDQEVEAWYLEGWCYFLMAEQARGIGGKLEDMTWEELAKDARDRLETCQLLHVNEGHSDIPLLDHARTLISQLEALGIQASAPLEEEDEDEDEWEDLDSEDGDGDVEMS